MTESNANQEMISIGACPTCGAAAQIIQEETGVSYRHMGYARKLSKKLARNARQREKRAVLAQMPYRDAAQWADGMVQVREVPMGRDGKATGWQVIFCGQAFPANLDKAVSDRHADNLRRTLRRKLRHYGAQEKRALCAVFGQRQKEGREILRPEIQAHREPAS